MLRKALDWFVANWSNNIYPFIIMIIGLFFAFNDHALGVALAALLLSWCNYIRTEGGGRDGG